MTQTQTSPVVNSQVLSEDLDNDDEDNNKKPKIKKESIAFADAFRVWEEYKPFFNQGGTWWRYHSEDNKKGWYKFDIDLAVSLVTCKLVRPTVDVLTSRLSLTCSTDPSMYYWVKPQLAVMQIEFEPAEINETCWLFNNGMYDFDAGEMKELKYKDADALLFGPRINFSYNPDRPRSQEFENMIKYAFPNDDTREYFQRIMSTIAAPHVPLRAYIVFEGAKRCRKTTIARAIGNAPAGSEGFVELSEKEIATDKYVRASLVGKFCCHADDPSPHPEWPEIVKNMCSGGTMSVQDKNIKRHTMPITHKHISSLNEFKYKGDSSGAFLNRVIFFHFVNSSPQTFSATENGPMIASYWKSQREGIIYWMMEGYERFLKLGTTVTSQEARDAYHGLVAEANEIETWVRNHITVCPDNFLVVNDFLPVISHLYPITETEHSIKIELGTYIRRIFNTKVSEKNIDKVRQRGYHGLKYTA